MIFLNTGTVSMLALFGSFGWPEGLIILGAMLLLFGGRKLPELARGLGKGIVEFKKGLKGVKDEIDSAGDEPEKTEPTPDTTPQTEEKQEEKQ